MTVPSESEPQCEPEPHKRDTSRTRRAILTAAGRNFSRRGYSKVSLQEIAGEAGITPARIVHLFGSKKGLFAAVVADNWGLPDRSEVSAPGADTVAELAREIVSYWNDRDVRSPALALVRSLDFEEAAELFRQEIERRIVSP
uniref:HTH tetR-type domain-containing protein n=2 Tax=Rhodococcus TaxID=1827 RepID=A0A221J3F7_RHOSG|nr:putative TetR-family transcriptional regulator [Rhodococcus sp. YL-1]ASM60829.1 hypothetical protein [Rhodococcus qingshengii]